LGRISFDLPLNVKSARSKISLTDGATLTVNLT